jgi:hypothetical protein
MRLAQALLVLAVVLVAGSCFRAVLAVYGAGLDGVVYALRGLALAVAFVVGAGFLRARRVPR